MISWNIFLGKTFIDTVHYDRTIPWSSVKEGLIRDGWNKRILVRKTSNVIPKQTDKNT